MNMTSSRFALALERLQSGDWARFEKFASQFLIPDYPTLRTVASNSGDLGRDSELFSPTGDPTVLLQYSVTKHWNTKIKETAKRVRENFKDALLLIYVTNQVIGADADELKKTVRSDFKLILDIHDRSWFIDRFQSKGREAISEELAIDIVDPYLSGRGVIESKAPALTEYEAKAAVLHLQLQFEDDSREKGLTKLSFEALVKSALRETSSETRITCQSLRDSIHKLLPNHPREIIDPQVNAAIERLDKKSIRRWRNADEICLTHEEALRVNASLTLKEAKDSALDAEIQHTLKDYFDKPIEDLIATKLSKRVRRILDTFLLNKGEEFAVAVATSTSVRLRDDSLDITVTNDFAVYPDDTNLGDRAVTAVRLAVSEILQRSNPQVQSYLRETADGYTLFAFLRAVPDVQKAIQKIFRDGEIWLDSSVLLPVFAETLLAPEEQVASRLLRAATDAGMKLFVTSGVVEEVERHINRCVVYGRMPSSQWVGGVPFLFAMHSLSGRKPETFHSWTEIFCGSERPADDIIDYLDTEWGIHIHDLGGMIEKAPTDLRWEIERIWREAHETRRARAGVDPDPFVIDRLVKHDVECYLGVIGMRNSNATSELGYAHWWLTFDKTVRDFEAKLYESLGSGTPRAPVMSPDFLASYLALGPVRERVSKAIGSTIPVAVMEILQGTVPAELVQIADDVRKTVAGANERLVKRKLRDALDSIKRKQGDYASGGFAKVRDQIEQSLRHSADQR